MIDKNSMIRVYVDDGTLELGPLDWCVLEKNSITGRVEGRFCCVENARVSKVTSRGKRKAT